MMWPMRSRLVVEVLVVVRADADQQRHLLDDVEAELAQLADLVGVVREQAHLLDAEIGEDAGGRRVVARVGGQAEREVGVDACRGRAPAGCRRAAC